MTVKKVAVYVRVSTKDQSVDMQLNDLERYSRERGFNVFKIYKDNGVSGTKETRPALSKLMALHQNLWVKIRKILIYIKEGSPKGISFIPFSAVHPSVQ